MSKTYDPNFRKKKTKPKKPQEKKVHSFPTERLKDIVLTLAAFDYDSLRRAYKKARRSKRDLEECIAFTLYLNQNLLALEKAIQDGSYIMSGYYSFLIHDPKTRMIHALHFVDRVVQHVLCDEILSRVLEPRLIYDNAACRIRKGTQFARDRLTQFMVDYRKHYGMTGWFLRFDFRKFFDNIDHEILKNKLRKIFFDEGLLALMFQIIDSYESTPGKGLPLGNQSSQWFAILYLDEFDRLVKEKLRVKYYTRYMDDGVMIFNTREEAEMVMEAITALAAELGLEFNDKTEIFPIKNGVDYLGFRFFYSRTGKVIRKVRPGTKNRFVKRMREIEHQLETGEITWGEAEEVRQSYKEYFKHAHAKGLIRKAETVSQNKKQRLGS